MGERFVVLNKGLQSSIYKIPAIQTARLRNELQEEAFELFEDLGAAKKAGLLIIERYAEAEKKQYLISEPDPELETRREAIEGLTESAVERFFI